MSSLLSVSGKRDRIMAQAARIAENPATWVCYLWRNPVRIDKAGLALLNLDYQKTEVLVLLHTREGMRRDDPKSIAEH